MINIERWHAYSFYVQMGNIASELSRAVNFDKKGDSTHMTASLLRLLELIDTTIRDPKNRRRLRELCRFKEVVADWYAGTCVYSIPRKTLRQYAMDFALLAGKMK